MSKSLRQYLKEELGFDMWSPIAIARDQKLRALYEDYLAEKPGAYEAFRDFVRNEYVARGLQWERDGWSHDFLEKYAIEVERNMDSGGVTFVKWDDGSTSHLTEEGYAKEESFYEHRVPWKQQD